MRAARLAALGIVCLAIGVGSVSCGGSDDESAGTTAGTTAGSTGPASGKPIVIGAAIDMTNFMSFFNLPALTAAQIEAAKINADGGVGGRPIVFKTQDTTLDPAKTKSAALDLLGKGADIIWVTCDVDYATPAVQEAINRGKLAIAPCIGTDQMGPKRFGSKGALAFSFGNVAQDEGAALAQMATDRGFKTAVVVKDKVLYYTQSVCDSFTAKFQELGGKIAKEVTFTQGDKTINNVVSDVNKTKSDAIAICTVTQQDLPAFVSGLRSVGNNTPIISPWSADGTFWLPKSPKVSNFFVVTFASVYGDDPDQNVRELIDKMKAKGKKSAPTTGGFITGASAVDALAHAIEAAGSTDGAKVAAELQKLSDFDTSTGAISFSSKFHTVFGRTYRVIQVTNGKAKYIGEVEAGTPANVG
jgi:branched-chain amino acid transport system substrate-binding protein